MSAKDTQSSNTEKTHSSNTEKTQSSNLESTPPETGWSRRLPIWFVQGIVRGTGSSLVKWSEDRWSLIDKIEKFLERVGDLF